MLQVIPVELYTTSHKLLQHMLRLIASKSTSKRLPTLLGNAGFTRTFSITTTKRDDVEVFIDGKSVKIEQGAALIQACEKAGVDIPRFCYHERLSIAGNCRMCLVEVEKSPKPVASCAIPVAPGMKVKTNTPLVHKAREGVMEFLLANHPLDCPICDQGGECDLQDQSMRYGADRGRFDEIVGKRAVEDKNLGPLVKTVMTRCIHCTRCVRFSNEIGGDYNLGTTGRGNDMQIGTYIEQTLGSEMSGNIIDLCPVGALTSKPYAFTARPWELKRTESVDVHDGIGSNIRVDSRGVEVMRVLPRLNDEVNEEWINDKTRFSYDGLKRQRLTMPLIREGGKFIAATWEQALHRVAAALKTARGDEIKAIVGQLADAESMVALKDLLNKLGSENLTVDGIRNNTSLAHGVDIRSNYILNTQLSPTEEADVVLLIGTNPRHEGAILNTRIRKGYIRNGTEVGLIGQPVDLSYDYQHLGETSAALEDLIAGKGSFAKLLQEAKRPVIIIGSGVAERSADAEYIFSKVAELAEKHKSTFFQDSWRAVNVLQRAAARTAAYDIGFTSNTQIVTPKFLYLLNADELEPSDVPDNAFVVYQGHHGDKGAHLADIVLPGAAYTEKNATYVNTEGRPQLTRAAVPPPGASREDWKILRALSEVAGSTLPYDDLHSLRDRMAEIAPHLIRYDVIEAPTSIISQIGLSSLKKNGARSSGRPLEIVIKDFYMTDPIARASSTMAKCSTLWTKKEKLEEPKLAYGY